MPNPHTFTGDPNFKQFFNNEIQAIVPERKGERGWNYEALIKYFRV